MTRASSIAAAEQWDRMRWGLLTSLALHMILWLAFMVPVARTTLPTFPENVPVEVWTGEEFERLAGEHATPVAPQPSPDARQSAAEPPGAAPQVGTLIRATRIMSGTVLADPLSRQARAMLPHLEEETRIEQLCGIEAMAQIAEWHREFQPDRVVAYALGSVRVTGRRIEAKGAAFRSRLRWYRLGLSCEVDPQLVSVQSFEFVVGGPIAKGAWERLGLPPVH